MSATEPSAPAGSGPAARPRWLIVSSLGVAQILAWGSSYYLVAVLAAPIAADTGWPLPWIVAGPSVGFLISGLVSPQVGRLIEDRGGRPVLAVSAVLLASGLIVLAWAPGIPGYVVAWLILGVAMGAGLYDPAFAALGRLYGDQARSMITYVTLFGGFASTICWPLSALLVERVGWRGTCLAYAVIQLFLVLPLYLVGVPREARHPPAAHPETFAATPTTSVRSGQRAAFLLLAATFTLASVIMTVISVHLLTLLQARGLALAGAVALGALIGPSQVGARVLEMMVGRNSHPVWTLVASTVLVAIGLGLLFASPGVAAAAIVLYGSGSGIRSIARGTVPLALFGKQGYATMMGRLAMPSLIATAASPTLGGLLIDSLGTNATMLVLFAAAVVNILPAILLVPLARRPAAAV